MSENADSVARNVPQNPETNKPIDLIQKVQASKILKTSNLTPVSPTNENFDGNQHKSELKNEGKNFTTVPVQQTNTSSSSIVRQNLPILSQVSKTDLPAQTLIAKTNVSTSSHAVKTTFPIQASSIKTNILVQSPTLRTNLPVQSSTIRMNIPIHTSTVKTNQVITQNIPQITSPSSISQSVSGFHIPRGAAVVANMTPSRSQNVSTVMRTTQYVSSSNANTVTTPRANIISQRVIPISSGTWIRPHSFVPKTQQFSGRSSITATRPSQVAVSHITSNRPSNSPSKAAVRPQTVAVSVSYPHTVRAHMSTFRFNSDAIRSQKGLQITNPSSKLLSPGTGSSAPLRGVVSPVFVTTATMYSPSSSLVTSLASSGTTITPHSVNKSVINPIRLTAAPSSVPVSSIGGICLRPSGAGTIITHHIAQNRAQTSENNSGKTSIITAQNVPSQAMSSKQTIAGLPIGTQIYSGSKIIGQSSNGATLTMTHLSGVSGAKPTSPIIQPGVVPISLQSSRITMARSSNGGTISMTKVIPQLKTLHATIPNAAMVGTSNVQTQDSPLHHSNVIVQKTAHTALNVPQVTSRISMHEERNQGTQYNISTPYYIEPTAAVSSSVKSVPVTLNQYISASTGNIKLTSPCAQISKDSKYGVEAKDIVTVPMIKNSSPRPSILRKRSEFDFGIASKAVKNLSSALHTPLRSPSPLRPESGSGSSSNSGSSTISANSSPENTIPDDEFCLIKSENPTVSGIKFEGEERQFKAFGADAKKQLETEYRSVKHEMPTSLETSEEISPRKRSRKQTLLGKQLVEEKIKEEFHDNQTPGVKRKKESISPSAFERHDESDFQESRTPPLIKKEPEIQHQPEPIIKKPQMSLLSSYRQTWKSRNNHFISYSDIRPREEKKRTVTDIANQKMASQKINGWKVAHMLGQVENMVDTEAEISGRLQNLLRGVESRKQIRKVYKDFDKDLNAVSELFKANMQRSIIIRDQMTEAKHQMEKILNHKENAVNILTKFSNKRSLRKKDFKF